ncbi:restriction system protein [Murinocardiopsis flavida]|uniref:Restriction system protein n=1 Tax=Murinocardiopsis flavida TaxID=645275 RepID=A0A2P8DKL3_9ACTN|nr:restriction endonuclease [Murinocardiopsis flavida]PSK97767.1 restriction system protein [Murinocardiopsis flavida]
MAPARRRRRSRRRSEQYRFAIAAAGVLLLLAGAWLWRNRAEVLPWLAPVAIAAAVLAVALVWLTRRLRDARLRRYLADHADLGFVDGLTGPAFELHVAMLLRRDGCTRVAVIGKAGDGGVDITGRTPGGVPFAVQCKLWKRPVPPKEIRDFQGVLATTHRGHAGVFVASGGFTAAARTAAGHSVLILVDRERLARWMSGKAPLRLPHAAAGAD